MAMLNVPKQYITLKPGTYDGKVREGMSKKAFDLHNKYIGTYQGRSDPQPQGSFARITQFSIESDARSPNHRATFSGELEMCLESGLEYLEARAFWEGLKENHGSVYILPTGSKIPTPEYIKDFLYHRSCNGKGCKQCAYAGSLHATLPRCPLCGTLIQIGDTDCGGRTLCCRYTQLSFEANNP